MMCYMAGDETGELELYYGKESESCLPGSNVPRRSLRRKVRHTLRASEKYWQIECIIMD